MLEARLKNFWGVEVSLAQYYDKVVLVSFWATWCGPCRTEIPRLIEFQRKYQERGFTVVGVAMDKGGRAMVEPYVQKERFNVNGQQLAINYPRVARQRCRGTTVWRGSRDSHQCADFAGGPGRQTLQWAYEPRRPTEGNRKTSVAKH